MYMILHIVHTIMYSYKYNSEQDLELDSQFYLCMELESKLRQFQIIFQNQRPMFILEINNYPTLVSKVLFYIYSFRHNSCASVNEHMFTITMPITQRINISIELQMCHICTHIKHIPIYLICF
jgi:hypothetical protein